MDLCDPWTDPSDQEDQDDQDDSQPQSDHDDAATEDEWPEPEEQWPDPWQFLGPPRACTHGTHATTPASRRRNIGPGLG